MNTLPIILVVDDNPANIETLANVLEPAYEVRFAMTGQQALDQLDERAPELVLLDVLLPDMDGYEVLRQIRTRPHLEDLPIIFVTALNDPIDEATGLERGAADYVTKPISPAIVRARVRNQLEIARNRKLLQRLTLTDSLTGLANRRHFDAALSNEVERLRRDDRSLSMLLIDIDHFKLYNDHYGHPAGDQCLRAVATVLSGELGRPIDLAARVGGEEFACLLPDTNMQGALAVAQRIRGTLNEGALPHAASPVSDRITVSIGAASADHWSPNLEVSLYQRADQALYRAKANGRNQVCQGD